MMAVASRMRRMSVVEEDEMQTLETYCGILPPLSRNDGSILA